MSDGISPPVLIGENVWWLGSGSGLPKRGIVRWIGRLPEIGPDWAVGIELVGTQYSAILYCNYLTIPSRHNNNLSTNGTRSFIHSYKFHLLCVRLHII